MNSMSLPRIALSSALVCIGAMISIPIGVISITLQSFFVYLNAIILKPKEAVASQVIYTALGLVGLPVFAGFKGGLSTIFSPSFGFIIAFIPASYVISRLYKNKSFFNSVIALIVATLVIYFIGVVYMYFILTRVNGVQLDILGALQLGVLPFIPLDILKIIAAAYLGQRISMGWRLSHNE